MIKAHNFHIPVMGIGFSIDTPIKVAQFGIDSVVSLVDDILIEKVRKMYCTKLDIPYKEISSKVKDFRAKRITSYLNLISDIAEEKFNELKAKNINTEQIKEYFEMLPQNSSLKKEFDKLSTKNFSFSKIKEWFNENMQMGSIDVNIMTKVDKDNYEGKEKLPKEFNDAHAALRGFANSHLESSIVLSAGLNPHLYSYISTFNDFFPDINGNIKKKIILKVSDYRSALIQGKFLAKKGIWVSEFRIESGLNCGGHAFASDGHMMGIILEEFKNKRNELKETLFELLSENLKSTGKTIPKEPLDIKFSAQGGIGTNEEHSFLLNYYNLNSVGWGTPFLLVPEVANVDKTTLNLMVNAKEDDLYLSDISPLGIPFNSLKGNTKDIERLKWINNNTPGSPCPKRYVALNYEFSEKGQCTASRPYQKAKIEELKTKNLSKEAYEREYTKITNKTCTCVGLGTPVLLNHNLENKAEGVGVAACPGPNMAYFSKISSLKEMVDHIYGRINLIKRKDRPNVFVNELNIYISYIKEKIEDYKFDINPKKRKELKNLIKNLDISNKYYFELFKNIKDYFSNKKDTIINDLEQIDININKLSKEISNL